MNDLHLYQHALKFAHEAGKILLTYKQQNFHIEEKKSHSDLVTEVDRKVEDYLISQIKEMYPDVGILGEEGIANNNIHEKETVWIIDPIDGTTNFIQNIPFYAISIGIMHHGEGIIGVVYNPETNDMFSALKGQGAYHNYRKIKIRNSLSLKETLVSTSMFWEDVNTKNALHPSIIQLHKDTRGIRMIGGSALSLCGVAKGQLGAYIMAKLNPWDFAGGVIILQEAGGIVTRLDASPVRLDTKGSIVAAHPDIHDKILSYFN